MTSTRALPGSYRPAGGVDVSQNERLLLTLNLIGLVIIGFSGWAFFWLLIWLRPYDAARAFRAVEIHTISQAALLTVLLLALTALHVIIHEAIHGAFFWIFTRSRPRFALRWTYAYAAAPDWYIARGPFLVTALAPLVLITMAGLLIFLLAPPGWILPAGFVTVMNAGGSAGDLLVVYRLLRLPRSSLVQDRGDAVTFYVETGPSP